MRLTMLLLALAVTVICAAAYGATGLRIVQPTAKQRAQILAGFGDPGAPARCLSVVLAASNQAYATVRFTGIHSNSCIKWGFNGQNVLLESGGRWRPVFEASAFPCPVAHVPAAVQHDLGICPH
jgi:hypothetical protein